MPNTSAKVLIIEDMPEFRLLVKSVLSKIGIEVLEAENGKDGIEILKKNEDIRLILLDVQLPDMDGFEILQAIQGIRDARPNLKISLLTGRKEKDDIIKAVKLQVDDYIVKPIDPIILRNKVSILLNATKIGADLAWVHVSFRATLCDAPFCHAFTIKDFSEMQLCFESSLEFIPQANFSMQCEKLSQILGLLNNNTYHVRVDSCEVISKDFRYHVFASFLGFSEPMMQKIRSYIAHNTKGNHPIK